MRKSLSKVLIMLIFLSIVTPSFTTAFATDRSTIPVSTNITVTNNAVIADTIYVTGLVATDVVKVYSTETGGIAIGTATVLAGRTDVLISIPKLPADSGSVYVTRKTIGMYESTRTPANYGVEPTSDSPNSGSITVVNNIAGKSDTITVSGLVATDVVKVYSAATGGTLLGTVKVPATKTEVTITKSQLGVDKGSVYVTVSKVGKKESARIEKAYIAEPISDPPTEANITVTNNSGIADTVKITGLVATDVVKIYSAATGGTLLGKATVPVTKTEATITKSQLGVNKGSIYVSVSSVGKRESARIEKSYIAEPISDAPTEANITIANNSGMADNIKITGLVATDVIKVYSVATGGVPIGTATVLAGKAEVLINISKLPADSGQVYVTRKSIGMNESTRTPANYGVEPTSVSPTPDNIKVVNNATGKADTITVSGLIATDVVKVYSAATGGTLLGTVKVPATKTEVTITKSQLGVDKGSVYVTVSKVGKKESARIEKAYIAEPMSTAPTEANIIVTNNSGMADNIKITGLVATDVIKVYSVATGGVPIATATVLAGKTEVSINILKLPADFGEVYVTRKSIGMNESTRTPANYGVESTSVSPTPDNITIVNNATGKADTITVTGLVATDVVKIYSAATGGALLGKATVPATKTDVNISVPQVGSVAGNIYISVSNLGKKESIRIEKPYSAEVRSAALPTDSITVTNNAGIPDTVKVTGIVATDVIKVYATATNGVAMGIATVLADKSEVLVNVGQLPAISGSVYVTITSAGMNESPRTLADYVQEVQSEAPEEGNITVTNNAGIADTINVSGLIETDIVKVYSAATSGTLLGKATVAITRGDVTVSIPQLGVGPAYITVTRLGKSESKRVAKTYSAEETTNKPIASQIIVTNNGAMADTITVTGLVKGDVVKVYSAAVGGILLGTVTLTSTETNVTVSVPQLGTTSGNVFVSVTNLGRKESERTLQTYTTEVKSDVLVDADIEITNNAQIADTIKVIKLAENDVVKVYASQISVTPIATATVAAGKTEATASVSNLNEGGGTVYIAITKFRKTESDRTAKVYVEEATTNIPTADQITVTNNGIIADIVKVTGLVKFDVIKVYSAAIGGTLLGTATVAENETAAASISQLGSTAGSVYVSITNLGKKESGRTAQTYNDEIKSDALVDADIMVTNYLEGKADTIKVTGLAKYDIIKVYSAAIGGTLLGTATVASYDSFATVSVSQLGIYEGNVYVTVTKLGKLESNRISKAYEAEGIISSISLEDIFVEKISGTELVTVKNLMDGDIVSIYSSSTNLTPISVNTVATGQTAVVLAVQPVVGESMYITVKRSGKLESLRIKVEYV